MLFIFLYFFYLSQPTASPPLYVRHWESERRVLDGETQYKIKQYMCRNEEIAPEINKIIVRMSHVT